MPSTLRTGVISAAVPDMNTSSAVQRFARQHLLTHFKAHVFRQLDDRVAGDARQRRRGERRGVNHAVFHFKQVLARPFGNVAVHVERDAFLIAVATRFAAHQQGGKIVAAGLGRSGDRVWCDAVRGGDHRIDALIQRFFTQISAPRKRRDNHVRFVTGRRVDAHADIADEHQRADVRADRLFLRSVARQASISSSTLCETGMR